MPPPLAILDPGLRAHHYLVPGLGAHHCLILDLEHAASILDHKPIILDLTGITLLDLSFPGSPTAPPPASPKYTATIINLITVILSSVSLVCPPPDC
jgi:hypothetical protein